MAVLSVDEYIKYLRKVRRINDITEARYNEVVRRLDLHTIDTDRLTELWRDLGERIVKFNTYGDVRIFFDDVARGLLNHNGVTVATSKEYNELSDTISLRTKDGEREPYTDGQIQTLLKLTDRAGDDHALYRLILLLTYSGIRIASSSAVKFSSMKLLPEGVYVFPVTSKKHSYPAFISAKAYHRMQDTNVHTMDAITNHREDTHKSSYSNYLRSKLAYEIISAGAQTALGAKTSIFHSCRKYFATRLAEDGLNSDDISLLLGHIPNSLAYKVYIKSPGRKPEHLVTRLAKAYAQSSFMKLELWNYA
jgi:integrase